LIKLSFNSFFRNVRTCKYTC